MSLPDVKVYDDSPEQYDLFQSQFFEKGSPLVAEAYQGMFHALGIDTGLQVLEVGVGTGLNLANYPKGANVVGFDKSEAMLAVARNRLEESAANVELTCGDATHLPFHDASFDVVVCSFVLCSCADPSRILSEVIRVCRPGGSIGLFDFHKARHNQGLLADQYLLQETLLVGLVWRGRRVAVCDTLYDLDEHLPSDGLEIAYDRHLEGSFSQAFRATALTRCD